MNEYKNCNASRVYYYRSSCKETQLQSINGLLNSTKGRNKNVCPKREQPWASNQRRGLGKYSREALGRGFVAVILELGTLIGIAAIVFEFLCVAYIALMTQGIYL